MAASTTPPSTESQPSSRAAVNATVRRCIAVAYSGGRDSTALLHATARMAKALNEALRRGPRDEGQGAEDRCAGEGLADQVPPALLHVVALHVHHGLSAHADEWLDHARSQCLSWAREGLPVSLDWRRVTLDMPAGASVEAVARDARYRALADMARAAGCDAVLLAHHRRDQAETFLLQALRSAGAAGLAAMPARALKHGVAWLRPWLTHSREQVEAYMAHHGLSHIDDDSNGDPRFARNRLRLAVWPAFAEAFDGAEERLAQAAAHQADLKACLDDWLATALPGVTRRRSNGLALDVAAWLACQPGPRRELLRAWFAQAADAALPLAGVRRLEQDLLRMAAESHGGTLKGSARWPWPCPTPSPASAAGGEQLVARRELMLYRGLLGVRQVHERTLQNDSSHAHGQATRALRRTMPSDTATPGASKPVDLHIHEPGQILLPVGLGVLNVKLIDQGGVALAALAHCRLAVRSGGEQFQLALNRPARSLKKQFQLLAVPAWARLGPLVYVGEQLVFVPGLGIDARARAGEGQPQVSLHWQPTQIDEKTDHTDIPDAKTGAQG